MNSSGKFGDVRVQRGEVPEWWAGVPEGERALIQAMMQMLRSAKRSPREGVARAAAKWERGLVCFIKVRLMGEAAGRAGRRQRVLKAWAVRIEQLAAKTGEEGK